MSANKRRKLDVGQGPQMLSAAALRRRLLERQASTSASVSAAVSETSGSSQPEDQPARSGYPAAGKGGSRAKPVNVAQQQKRENSRALEDVLLGQSGVLATEEVEVNEAIDEAPKRKVVQLSSTTLNKSNSQRKADGTVVLRFTSSSERLVILGSYGFRVKSGEASIYGASCAPSDTIHWVHAPQCHALPVLRCSEDSLVELHSHPAAPALRNLERLSPVFTSLWNQPIPEASAQTWQVLGSSADAPKKVIVQDLRSPPEWNRKTAQLLNASIGASPPIYFLCGPKSSGKSTYARMLANRLLTHRSQPKQQQPKWSAVTILDIDPGQPEFSPPGTISLVRLDTPNLAAPFCHPLVHPKAIIRSHAVASITPASDIEHYKSCVLDLFSHYQSTKSCGSCPLIVNTPGWIQGTGLILLQDLVFAIRPAEILYMSQDGPEDTVDGLKMAAAALCSSSTINNSGTSSPALLTTLPSQSSDYTSRTALHLRHMQTMSYFHVDGDQCFGNKKKQQAGIHWNDIPLTATPPIMVSYSSRGQEHPTTNADNGVLGIMCYGYQSEPELLADAINGSILAIVEIEDPRAFGGDNQLQQLGVVGAEDTQIPPITTTHDQYHLPYIRSQAPLDPRFSSCLGLGLIRGIDTARREIALSTPIAPDLLASSSSSGPSSNNKNNKSATRTKPIVLVSGKFDPPTWAYTEDHYYRASKTSSSGYANHEGEEEEEEAEDDGDEGVEEMPWTEKLVGNQKRAVGSKVWRVRRDLGRNGAGGGD